MKKFLVRSEKAGVFFGEIKERIGNEVTMINVRRIHKWSGAASLSQLSLEGVKNPEECRFTMTVPEIVIFGVIEIIPCSKDAVNNINSVPVWKIE